MNTRLAPLGSCVLACAIAVALASPAAADGGVSVNAGAAFLLDANAQSIGGTVQPSIGLGYDFGPRTVLPVRVSLDLNYTGGSNNGGSISAFGLGVGARLTTPAYIGAALSLDDVNVHPPAVSFPAGGGNGAGQVPASSTVGFGESIFVGQRLLAIPGGGGLALQATYRHAPSSGGYDPSSLTLGLRASF